MIDIKFDIINSISELKSFHNQELTITKLNGLSNKVYELRNS